LKTELPAVDAQRQISHAIAMAEDPPQPLNTGRGMMSRDKGLLPVLNLNDLSQEAFGRKRWIIVRSAISTCNEMQRAIENEQALDAMNEKTRAVLEKTYISNSEFARAPALDGKNVAWPDGREHALTRNFQT
jgi:hypothetical protein